MKNKIFFSLMACIALSCLVRAEVHFTANPGDVIDSSFAIVPSDIVAMSAISPFNVTLIQTNFNAQDQSTSIQYEIDIPDKMQSGIYETRIIVDKRKSETVSCGDTDVNVSYDYTQIIETVIVTVNELYNYSIYPDTINLSLDSNTNSTVSVEVRNTGNQELAIRITSPRTVFQVDRTIYLSPYSNATVQFDYNILPGMFGRSDIPILFDHISSSYNVPDKAMYIHLNIADKTLPNITANISESRIVYGDSFNICWEAADEAGIRLVYMYYNNVNTSVSEKGCSRLVTNATGMIPVVFQAIDNNFNQRTLTVNVNVSKVSVGEVVTDFRFKTIVPNSKAMEKIMYLEKPTLVTVQVLTQYLIPNVTASPSVSLISGSQEVILQNNKPVNFTLDGNVYLTISGALVGDYSAKIGLVFPEWANQTTTVLDFTGSIKEYGVCKNTTQLIWGQSFTSTPVDNGNEQDSYCLLSGRFPIDSNFSSDVRPCSAALQQQYQTTMEQQYTITISQKDEEISMRGWVIILLIVLMVISTGFLFLKERAKGVKIRV